MDCLSILCALPFILLTSLLSGKKYKVQILLNFTGVVMKIIRKTMPSFKFSTNQYQIYSSVALVQRLNSHDFTILHD